MSDIAAEHAKLSRKDQDELALAVADLVEYWETDRPALAEAIASVGMGWQPSLEPLSTHEIGMFLTAMACYGGPVDWNDLDLGELLPTTNAGAPQLAPVFNAAAVEVAAERDRRKADNRTADAIEDEEFGGVHLVGEPYQIPENEPDDGKT